MLVQVPLAQSLEPQADLPATGVLRNGIYAPARGGSATLGSGSWVAAGRQAALDCSALGLLLASAIQKASGVPIGIIQVRLLAEVSSLDRLV